MADSPDRIRIDKWLWFARFFKTRSLASKQVQAGGVRVNGTPVAKPAVMVGPGDILTFPQARAVRVIEVEAIGLRRGPAAEAQTLYRDLSPPKATHEPQSAPIRRLEGNARPTKKDRRQLDLDRRKALE